MSISNLRLQTTDQTGLESTWVSASQSLLLSLQFLLSTFSGGFLLQCSFSLIDHISKRPKRVIYIFTRLEGSKCVIEIAYSSSLLKAGFISEFKIISA